MRSLGGSSCTIARFQLGQAHQDELGDAISRRQADGLAQVGVVRDHVDVAAIPGIDQPGAVQQREALAQRETGARHHEPRMALGDRQAQARAHAASLAGRDLDVLDRAQVEPGIVGVGPRGESRRRMAEHDRQLAHAPPAASRACSGTRNSA